MWIDVSRPTFEVRPMNSGLYTDIGHPSQEVCANLFKETRMYSKILYNSSELYFDPIQSTAGIRRDF